MKISVRSDGLRLSLVVPARTGIWIAAKALGKGSPELAGFFRREKRALCAVCRQARRVHAGLELVRVESADGTHVVISL